MGEISDALARAQESEKGAHPAAAPRDGRPPRLASPQRSPSPLARALREERAEPSEDGASAHSRDVADTDTDTDTSRAEPVRRTRGVHAEDHHSEGDLAPERSAARAPYHQIPVDREGKWVERACAVDPEGAVAVRFRHLAVRMRGLLDRSPRPSLLVTSALSGEGKTTVAVNLAIALASIAPECRIALVDLDLHRGRIGRVMGYTGTAGVGSMLAGRAALAEIGVRTDLPALDFYPVCSPVHDAHSLLGAASERFFAELHARYDYVVIDGPPVLPVPDVPLILPHVGGCLAVASSGKTRHRTFREMIDILPRGSALGVFLNNSPASAAQREYRYGPEAAAPVPEALAEEGDAPASADTEASK